jgi:lysophospholipase L1-like esterase
MRSITALIGGGVAALLATALLGAHYGRWQPAHRGHVQVLPLADPCRFVANLEAGKAQTIVAYGTSLTAGSTWPSLVGARLDELAPGLATVVNAGQDGMASGWGLDHIDERVLSRRPDTVLIEFSINDAYVPYGISVAQARVNLWTMVNRCEREGVEVILLLLNRPTGRPAVDRPMLAEYEAMYRDVASERGLRLIDLGQAWDEVRRDGAAWRAFAPDGIHPNDLGSREVTAPNLLRGLGVSPD